VRVRNQQALLRAAEQVFARAGFAGATVAEIATTAGVPKANLHYYYPAKRDLYRAVLSNILALWLAETDGIRADADPAAAIEAYIRAKMRFSRSHPDASRVFANEILHGAPEIGPFLSGELRTLVAAKARVMRGWVAEGRMADLDPVHLFFALWAVTQTYADFAVQVCAVSGVARLSDRAYARATESVVRLFAGALAPRAALRGRPRRIQPSPPSTA
jgi:TetR/AcrR family transcriptional regulator